MSRPCTPMLCLQVLRAEGLPHSLYFIFVILLGSFYLVNLILAIVAMSYEDQQKADQNDAEEARQEKEVSLHPVTCFFCDLWSTGCLRHVKPLVPIIGLKFMFVSNNMSRNRYKNDQRGGKKIQSALKPGSVSRVETHNCLCLRPRCQIRTSPSPAPAEGIMAACACPFTWSPLPKWMRIQCNNT